MVKKKHVVKTGLQEFNNFVIFQTETGKVNIFKEGELEEKVVVSILESTTQHGAIEGKTQGRGGISENLYRLIK